MRPKLLFLVLPVALFVNLCTFAQTLRLPCWLLNKNENSLAIVDPESLKVIARIPTGEGPHEVTASDDGKFAFVANYGAREPGSTISVVDLVHQHELRRVNLGPLRRPHGHRLRKWTCLFHSRNQQSHWTLFTHRRQRGLVAGYGTGRYTHARDQQRPGDFHVEQRL